jgi:hypothetical protein
LGARFGRPRIARAWAWPNRLRWGVLLGLTLLSGCGWFSSDEPEKRPIVAAAACPTAAILRPLGQTAVFAPGQSRQQVGVAFYGLLSEVSATCERAGDALRLKLDVVVVGERGPAAGTGSAVDLWYFVAVTGPDQAILGKRLLPVHITIPADAKRAGISDHIEEIIPLGGRSAGDLSVVLGFQQSPEAVEFYRNKQGR